ncbi:MAG TPA: FUSC family protein [Longimicrobium sp.]|nr:FUSC family protein [Longimicrobium sp.]
MANTETVQEPQPLVAAPHVHGRVRELARFSVRPNLGAGLRAGVATVGPILVGHALGIGEEATWLGLAGFSTAIGDKGGAYATRARTMSALAAGIALSGIVGGLASGRPHIAIPLILLWATAGALMRAFGAAAGTVGLSAVITFVISLSLPAPTLASALERGGLLLAGSAFAMGLSLFLWPIRAYAPARGALAECWRALAEYADSVAHAEPRDFGRFRAALEAARTTLAETRRGRPGESGRGERLLMLAETANRTFAALTALGGALDAAVWNGNDEGVDEARRAAAQVAALARELADAVARERAPAPPPFPADDTPVGGWLDRLAGALRREATLGWQAAAGVESGRPVRLPDNPAESRQTVMEVLRENLTLRSVALRHALRVGVTAALATALAHFLGVERGYWVTLTALIVLQPSAGATWVKGVQRIGGTVAGGIVAAGIIALVHDPAVLLAFVFVLAVAAVSVLLVNYGVYSTLLTPTFVLLAESSALDPHLAGIRIVNTLIGGLLALVAARVLWPAPEGETFRARLTEAVRALAVYVRVATRRHAHAATRAEADEARRAAGLAVLNAEESLQLVLWEGRRDRTGEAGMAALAYVRRAAEATNALGYAPASRPEAAGHVAAFGEAAERALDALADSLERPPDELHVPDLAAPPSKPVVERLMSEIAADVRALGGTLARGLVAARAEEAETVASRSAPDAPQGPLPGA